jgi:poly-gamma-glutamate capsule biosynthesis protein CapA/YwtB (metallophosphatase superfamily)
VSFRQSALTVVAVAIVAAFVAQLAPGADDVRLLFAGDVLLSRQVAVEMRRTGASPFDSIAPLFADADWSAGNLEGAIGTDADCVAADRGLCFADADTTPQLLARAHLRAMSVENNHAADAGPVGRDRTRAALDAAGVLGLDFAHSPRFVRVGGITLGVVAVNLVPGADGVVESVPSVELAQKLRLARTLANVVVVSIHWGTELQEWANASQRAQAEWLVDHGADVVIGHHPHVIQNPECVHGKPVFFSLGNDVFDQRYPATKDGLIADCRISGDRLRCGSVRTHARQGSAMPVLANGGRTSPLDGCTVRAGPSLVAGGYELRPEPWSAATTDSGFALEAWKNGAIEWRSRRVRLVSLQTGLATGGSAHSLLALERHPSDMDGEIAIRPYVYDVGADGLIARWRGTALAWPLIDATVDARGTLCALHRGDSFIRPDPTIAHTRTMRYRWNGFGFSATPDTAGACASAMRSLAGG